jgi:repressor LexA
MESSTAANSAAAVPVQVRDILEAIQRHEREHRIAPSVRELCAVLGYSSPSSVHRWLRIAQGLGLVRLTTGREKRYVPMELA